jgi:nitrate/nitrite-specific signal transduction histidine kinase
MILKELHTLGFSFNKLPDALQKVVDSLTKATDGTFETENQKLNVLDYYLWEAVRNLNQNDEIVHKVAEMYENNAAMINNNSFNTEVTIKDEVEREASFSDLGSAQYTPEADDVSSIIEGLKLLDNTEEIIEGLELLREQNKGYE